MKVTLTLSDLRAAERLLDDDVATCKRMRCQSPTHPTHQRNSARTLRPEGNANSVREDVDALEDARAALVGELDLLVRAALERGLRSLGRCAADGGRRCAGQTVHGGRS